MLEKLISDMLNKHLSKFIESIDEKQLGATLFNSSILLTNMRLKSTMFEDSPLPFALRYGQIGKIFLKIPIWDMFKTPLVIEIEDIVAVVGLKPMAQWSAEQQRQAFLETNQEVLEQFELFIKSQMVLQETERESACSFTDKLLARILDNLQISIKNIYFRFEDRMLQSSGYSSAKYSIGIKLKEFSIFTGDRNFEKIKQIADGQGTAGGRSLLTFKVAKIEGFSLFCDWQDVDVPENGGIDLAALQKQMEDGQDKKSKKAAGDAGTRTYFQKIIEREFSADPKKSIKHKNLIQDLQFELRIEINKDIRNPLMPATLEFPQIKASVVMGRKDGDMSTQVNLYQPQLLRVLRTVEVIGHFNEFKDGVLSDYLTRKLTAAEKTTYIENYMAWVQLSREKEKGKKKDDDKTESSQIKAKYEAMRQIEDQVHHDVIIVIRKSAIGKLQSEDGRQIALDQIEEQIQKQIRKEAGFGLFLTESKRRKLEQTVRASFAPEIAAVKQKYDDQDQEMSQHMMDLVNDFQIQDDEESSSGEEHTQDIIDFSNLPQEYVRLEVDFSMPSLTFFLENEFGQVITNLQVQGIKFTFDFANKFTKANMSIENFGIKDLWAQSEVWPDFLQTVQQEKQQQAITEGENQEKKLAISVSFEQNKDFVACPFHVVLKLEKSLQIVANLPLINEVMRTMTLALSDQKLDFEYFIQMALGRVNEIKSTAKQYSENVKQGKQEHVNLSIEANIQAPILVIPADIYDQHANVIKLDFGSMRLRSELVKYNPNTNYKAIEDETELYDKYLLNTQGFSLQIVNAATQQASVIVDDIFLAATVKNCVEPLHPKVPALQVDFDLAEKIKAQFDLTLAQQLLVIKNHLLLQLKNNIFLMVSLKIKDQRKKNPKQPKDVEVLEEQQSKAKEAAQEELTRSVEQMRQKAKMQSNQTTRKSFTMENQEQLQKKQQAPEQHQMEEKPAQKQPQEEQKTTGVRQNTREMDKANTQKGKGEMLDLTKRSSSIVVNFKISSIELEFDSSNKFEADIENEKEFIGLVFELRNFSSRITHIHSLESEAQDITITAGVQQVETLELTKAEMANRKQNQGLDIGRVSERENMPEAQVGIFSKVMFRNENKDLQQLQKNEKSNDDQLVLESGKGREEFQFRSTIKVHISNSEYEGSDLEKMEVEIDVKMNRTIFVCRIATMQKVLATVFKVVKLVNAGAQDEKEKIFLQKQQVIDALVDSRGGEIAGESPQEHQDAQYAHEHRQVQSKAFINVTNKIYKNLATQNDMEGSEAIKQFIDDCIDIIESSDIDLQPRQGRGRATSKATSFKKLYVITQSYHKMHVKFKAEVEQIELWINDYQGENDKQIAQTLVFKVGGEFKAKMSELAKELRCTKSENPQKNSKLRDFAFNDSVDVVKLALEEELEVEANIANISIGQSIVDSWEGALEVLRNPSSTNDRIRHTKSDLLLPTSVGASLTSKSQFKLDKATRITLELKPLSFRADFKDVALTYRFFNSMEEMLQSLKENLIEKKTTINMNNEGQGPADESANAYHASNVSLLRRMSTIVAGGVQDPDGASEGDERLTSASSKPEKGDGREGNEAATHTLSSLEQQPDHSLEPISSTSAAYKASIDYNFGDLVYQDEPIMFKTECLEIEVAVPKIQIEFCDGQLQSHLQDIDPTPTPLLQVQMKKMELRMGQRGINAEFEPTQRSTIAYVSKTSRRKTTVKQLEDGNEEGREKPSLEVQGKMEIESTYFNQISQVFEPFIEPWSLHADVCQASEDAIFEIKLRSADLLNVNITYGMALSLRNIFVQVQDDIAEIDECCKKENQTAQPSRQSTGQSRDNERQNYDMSKSMIEREKKKTDACGERAENKDSKYAFQNHTGLDIQMYFARPTPVERIAANQQILTQKQTTTFKKHLNERKLPDCPIEYVGSAFFDKEQEEQPQKSSTSEAVAKQDNDKNGQRQLEDDPLLIDLEVQGAHRITNIPIENNGVFSYSLLPSNSEAPEGSDAAGFSNISDVVNMVVNITNIGNQRLVSLESQLIFENNINFPVTLQFVFKDRFQKEIDWQASNDIITVKLHPKEQFRVPLFWYFVDKHFFSVDVYIVQKKDDSQFEDDMTKPNILLFSDITSRFNKVCKSMENKPHFLKGIEAQIVELNTDQYVSVDINGFKCLPKQTRDENPIQYFVALSPPLVLTNQSMLPLELFEIDWPGTEQQKTKLQSRIPPSMSANVLSLDLAVTNQSLYKLRFRDNDANMYITKEFQHFGTKESWTERFARHATSEPNELVTIEMKEGQTTTVGVGSGLENQLVPKADYLNNGPASIAAPGYCNMEMEISHGHGSSADPSRHQVISESKALKLDIRPKYLIVNKSAVDIYYQDQLVKAYSSEVLNIDVRDRRNVKTTKIKIKALDFKESMDIDLNSIGLSGTITLESSNTNKDLKNKQQLQFGVKIGLAPVPFNKTTVLTITPRYVIVNKLDYAVLLRMPLRKQKQHSDQQQMELLKVDNRELENQKEIHLPKTSLSSDDVDKVKNSIQFKVENQESSLNADAAKDEALWTLPFQIDQLEDFQTQLVIENGRSQDQEQMLESQHAPGSNGLVEWYEPQRYNNWRQIVRVSISPNDDDTTLFVILSNPAVEEFICKNTTQSTLLFTKYDKQNQSAIGSQQQLDSNSSCAFVWDARDKHAKDVMAQIGKHKAIISLDKISQLSKKKKHLQRKLQKQLLFSIKNENGQAEKYYSTLKTTADGTKVLSISCGSDLAKDVGPHERKKIDKRETEANEMAAEQIEQLEESKTDISLAQELQEAEAKQTDGFSLQINLRGLGISIIDKRPKELVYISIDNIHVAFGMEVLKDQMHKQEQRSISHVVVMNEIRSELDVRIGNFQIDNLINDVMPVIAGAKELYQPNLKPAKIHSEVEEDQELDRLFKNIDTGRQNKDGDGNQATRRSKAAEEAPFLLLKVSRSERQFQGKVGSIVRFDEIHLAMQEFFVQVETGILESNLSFLSQIVALFYEKVDNCVEPEQYFEDIKDSKRSEICPYVDASPRFFIDESKLKVRKISFGIIMLGSIKMSLTLQLEKTRRLDREIATNSPALSGVLYLLAPVVQNFANISDLAIKCNELVILEAFISQDLLIKNISDHYIHQFKRQIFRILGSSDLLGNPANLLSKVGVGFYELARDPLQGMLQGPRGFVAGVGTGMQGVVRGVVGGGFESLSHISGSLYSVVKQTAGDADTRAQKAENFSQGLEQGVKGLGTEVSKGVTGIFSKPFEGAKRSGFKGFTAGIGKGLLGAVATPVAGVLRAGESVAQGISGSANNLSNIGKSEIELLDPRGVRVRPARRIDHKGKITIYDRNLAIINYYLANVARKRLANEQLRFYEIIPSIDAAGNISKTKKNILIITGNHFVVLEALNLKNMLKPKLVEDSHRICLRLNKIVKYVVLLSPNKQIGAKRSKNKDVELVDRYCFLSLISLDGNFSSRRYLEQERKGGKEGNTQHQDAATQPTQYPAAHGTVSPSASLLSSSASRVDVDKEKKKKKNAPPKNAMIEYAESQKLTSVSGVPQNQHSVLPEHFGSGEVTHTIFEDKKLDPESLEVDWTSIKFAPKHRTVVMATDFATFDGVHHILNRLGALAQNIQAAYHLPEMKGWN